ncbi:DUF2577 family protein [Heyndrickxia oleronia]|uniref:DUF2577 family protein n=1 Tax=Heyndrickxia oleronia TaxID=38875 RepID=UPI001B2A3558|nr:DUF2577 family protein [Heyndrickxia oleronia]GIN39603.1 hypothetical protein J19TS1_25520 [Heyndrickxia oleronia]
MKKKWLKREGGIYDKFGQMIRETGYSKPVNIEVATVVEAPPNLRIKLDAESLVLEKEDLIVAQSLTKHERKVSLKSSNIGGETAPAGVGPHTHGYESIDIQEGLLTFEDELAVGDRVIVGCLDEDMIYIVLDRAVWY